MIVFDPGFNGAVAHCVSIRINNWITEERFHCYG